MLTKRSALILGMSAIGLSLLGCSNDSATNGKPAVGEASAQKYRAGVDFVEVSSGLAPKVDQKVRIDEFFWYACPHCYTFKPRMERWKTANAAKVHVNLAAVPLGVKWTPMSQAYYALESLGFDQLVHDAIFNAWHVDKKDLNPLPNLLDVVRSVKDASYAQAFEKAYSSQEVLEKVEQVKALAVKIGVESTPSVLVAGKYLLNTRQGYEHTVSVMNFLVEKELSLP